MTHAPSDNLDVVVIGAGQAGLALGYHLARQRRRFVIVEVAVVLRRGSAGSAFFLRIRRPNPLRLVRLEQRVEHTASSDELLHAENRITVAKHGDARRALEGVRDEIQ